MSHIDIHCGKNHANVIQSNDDWDVDVHWIDQEDREFIADLRIGVNQDENLFIEIGCELVLIITRNMDIIHVK